MSEHRFDIRISESYVDPNPPKVERQDPDNFTCFQTHKRCAWEIAAYVFKKRLFRRSNELIDASNEYLNRIYYWNNKTFFYL